jgi:hypothetical protein
VAGGAELGAAVPDTDLRRAVEAVEAVCVAVCRSERPEVPDLPGVEDELVAAVRFHRIAPLAHVALREVRPGLAARLREDRDLALAHHVRVTASLAALGDTLSGIPWLVFKGPVLSETLHPVPGLRSYHDLDVLVGPSHLREAAERLLGTGWQVLATREDLLNGQVTGELELGRPGGAVVDLHWSLVLSETLRRRFPVPTDVLLSRSSSVAVGPVEVQTLDDTDTLVHLCHHAAFSGAVRLVHLLDVDQASRRVADWDEVVRRAGSWGAAAQVGLVLARAGRVLGTPVPPDLDRRLGLSRSFTALTSAVDRARPVTAVRREASWPRLVARAARSSALATAATALQNAVSGAANRVRSAPATEPQSRAGRDDVEAWFAAVEAVATTRPKS